MLVQIMAGVLGPFVIDTVMTMDVVTVPESRAVTLHLPWRKLTYIAFAGEGGLLPLADDSLEAVVRTNASPRSVFRATSMSSAAELACPQAQRYDVLCCAMGYCNSTLQLRAAPPGCTAVLVFDAVLVFETHAAGGDAEGQFQRLVAPVVGAGRRWRGWRRVWCTLLAAGGAEVAP